MRVAVVVVVAIAAVAAAAAREIGSTGPHTRHWRRGARAADAHEHEVIVAVKLRADAAATCDQMLREVAYPGGARYMRNNYTFDDMRQFTDQAAFEAVVKFLARRGVGAHKLIATPNHEFVRARLTAAQLRNVFAAELYAFAARERPSLVVYRAASGYRVPAELAPHIDFVGQLATLPPPPSRALPMLRRRGGAGALAARQSGDVSPALLNQFYGVGNNTVASSRSDQSLFEALGQSFAPADLQAFQQQFNLPAVVVSKVIGPNDPSSCQSDPNNCGEANLDVQWITAIASTSKTWYWSIPGDGDIFLQWIVAVAANPNAPHVHSMSYGSLAPEDPKNDMERFNTEACKLGLRGLTVVISSGDDGVANFDARSDPSQCGFTPSFPATSPYVVAVGATQGPEAGQPEIACTSDAGGLITTGGGFSIVFPRPDYQAAAVTGYLKNGPNLPPKNLFTSTGRAYPDVALMGHNYPIFIAGSEYVGSGTSASSPVFAGMLTLINGLRFAAGKGPLGFINPTLYHLGGTSVFNDITVGENNCCAGNPGQQVCCQYGFNATTGWDPVTGWGSVNFPALSRALMAV